MRFFPPLSAILPRQQAFLSESGVEDVGVQTLVQQAHGNFVRRGVAQEDAQPARREGVGFALRHSSSLSMEQSGATLGRVALHNVVSGAPANRSATGMAIVGRQSKLTRCVSLATSGPA